jgi:hypothetical protein
MARTETEHGVGGWIRYGLPGLVIGLAMAWGLEGRGPKVLAQAPLGAGGQGASGVSVDRSRPTTTTATEGAAGTIAMAVPGTGSSQNLYLIDTRTKALAVYRIDPSSQEKGAIKLLAARQYHWDLQLTEYNCLPPEVAAIESTVRSLGRQPIR